MSAESTRWEWDAGNVVRAAGYYSQLTGVLAGFAFAGLALLLSGLDGGDVGARPLFGAACLNLLTAFFQMTLSSYLYGQLAAERSDRSEDTYRTHVLLTLVGAIFALSAIQMFYSMVLLLNVYALPSVTLRPVRLVMWAVELVTTFQLVALSYDATRSKPRSQHWGTWTAWGMVPLVGIWGLCYIVRTALGPLLLEPVLLPAIPYATTVFAVLLAGLYCIASYAQMQDGREYLPGWLKGSAYGVFLTIIAAFELTVPC